MKARLVLLFSLITSIVFSQDVQWASKVIEYSSQFSGRDFSAEQAVGPPNVLNFGGKDAKAWMASSPDNQEYLVLGFESPVKARQIIIVESSNPGSIYMVYVYDESNTMHLVGELIPGPLDIKNRILNIFLPNTEINISAVRIVTDGSKVPGANSIDAVGLSNSVLPVQFGENFAFRLNPRLAKRVVDLNAQGEESDIRPVYSSEESTLFFTRGYSAANVGGVNDPGDVWYSTYNATNGKYSDPVRLSETINNIGFNTSNAYYKYYDNPRLMVGNVSGSGSKVKTNLSSVSKKDGEWVTYDIQKIKGGSEIPVDADYTITDNGNVLIISTELRDTKGGTDLYIAYSEGENKWSEPINMGGVNTAEDEYAPFFSMQENVLYFTSKGFPGLGGSDIFRVKRMDDSWTNWSEPENIGADINSDQTDHYFYFDDKDSYAYYAQSTSGGGMNIVRIERPRFMEANPLVVVKGKVLDEKTASPVNALLSLLVLPEEELYGVTFPEENSGNYQIFLRSGYKYRLVGEKAGYKPVDMPVTLENKGKPYTFDLNVFLSRDLVESEPALAAEVMALGAGLETYDEGKASPEKVEVEEEIKDSGRSEETRRVEAAAAVAAKPAEAQEPARPEPWDKVTPVVASQRTISRPAIPDDSGNLLNLVIFNFDSDILLSPSFPVLDAMAAFMQRHPDIKLEIGGFTDYIGDYYYNIELSRRRAYSVRQYIIDQGIERARTKVIGFGEKMPVIEGRDSEQMALNRRAEFNFTRY